MPTIIDFFPVESPILPPHLIPADQIIAIRWGWLGRPQVWLQFTDGRTDVVTEGSGQKLADAGYIPRQ